MKKKGFDLSAALKHLKVYLPVALTNQQGTVPKLYNKVQRAVDGQPIEDVTTALAIMLGQVLDQWHTKQPQKRTKKAA